MSNYQNNRGNLLFSNSIRSKRHLLLSASFAILATVATVAPKSAMAAISNGVALRQEGKEEVTFSRTALATVVDQKNNVNAVIRWQRFEMDSNESITFIVPAGGATLNRVVDGIAKISGTVTSNGTLYFVSPNGITIDASARITANGFIASMVNFNISGFGSETTAFGSQLSTPVQGGSRAINLNGEIIAGSGNVSIYAPTVYIGGTITTSGTVYIAAANTVSASAGVVTLTGTSTNMIGSSSTATATIKGATTVTLESKGLISLSNSLTVTADSAEVKLDSSGGITIHGEINVSGAESKLNLTAKGLITNTKVNTSYKVTAGTLKVTQKDSGNRVVTLKNMNIANLGVVVFSTGANDNKFSLTNIKSLNVLGGTTMAGQMTVKTEGAGSNIDLIDNPENPLVLNYLTINSSLTSSLLILTPSLIIESAGNVTSSIKFTTTVQEAKITAAGKVSFNNTHISSARALTITSNQEGIEVNSGATLSGSTEVTVTANFGTLYSDNLSKILSPGGTVTLRSYNSNFDNQWATNGFSYAISVGRVSGRDVRLYSDYGIYLHEDMITNNLDGTNTEKPGITATGATGSTGSIVINSAGGILVAGNLDAKTAISLNSVSSNIKILNSSFTSGGTILVNSAEGIVVGDYTTGVLANFTASTTITLNSTSNNIEISKGSLTSNGTILINSAEDIVVGGNLTANGNITLTAMEGNITGINSAIVSVLSTGNILMKTPKGDIDTQNAILDTYNGKVILIAGTTFDLESVTPTGSIGKITVGQVTAVLRGAGTPSSPLSPNYAIDITATGKILVVGELKSTSRNTGTAGYWPLANIKLNSTAGAVVLDSIGSISTKGNGDSGAKTGSMPTVYSYEGNGGDVTITAKSSITLDGTIAAGRNYSNNDPSQGLNIFPNGVPDNAGGEGDVSISSTTRGDITINKNITADGWVRVNTTIGNITQGAESTITSDPLLRTNGTDIWHTSTELKANGGMVTVHGKIYSDRINISGDSITIDGTLKTHLTRIVPTTYGLTLVSRTGGIDLTGGKITVASGYISINSATYIKQEADVIQTETVVGRQSYLKNIGTGSVKFEAKGTIEFLGDTNQSNNSVIEVLVNGVKKSAVRTGTGKFTVNTIPAVTP